MMEVDKIIKVKDESLLLSEFLDWLTGHEYHICKFHNSEDCSWAEEFRPKSISNEQLLADYFEIDLNKVERERDQILEELRQG